MCKSPRLCDLTSGVNVELCRNAEDLMVKDNIVEASRSMGKFGNLRLMNIPRLSLNTLFLEVSLLSSLSYFSFLLFYSLSHSFSPCLSLFQFLVPLVFPSFSSFPFSFLLSFSFNPFPKSVFLPFLPHLPFHLPPQFLLFSNNAILSF